MKIKGVYISIYVCIYLYINEYVCICMSMYKYVYTYLYLCVYIYIYVHRKRFEMKEIGVHMIHILCEYIFMSIYIIKHYVYRSCVCTERWGGSTGLCICSLRWAMKLCINSVVGSGQLSLMLGFFSLLGMCIYVCKYSYI
jgi:hypothetical protein